jgi:hypothetical protein
MTNMQQPEPAPSPLRDDAGAKLPAAAYLRYAQRADGWSAGRQAACLAHLADNGLIADAVRSVGMSVGGCYALRRTARGYAFNLGWEAALIIARRIVADNLMTAAIRGEESRWVREDGVTTYTRQNTKLSLALLERVNPATALPEVLAVAVRFDCYLQMIDEGLSAQELWELFFDVALLHSDIEARARVRAALLLSEESEGFEEQDDDKDDADIEYKSMDGPPAKAPSPDEIDRHLARIAAIGVKAAFDDAALPFTIDQHHRAASGAIDRRVDKDGLADIIGNALIAEHREQDVAVVARFQPAGKRRLRHAAARPGLTRMTV